MRRDSPSVRIRRWPGAYRRDRIRQVRERSSFVEASRSKISRRISIAKGTKPASDEVHCRLAVSLYAGSSRLRDKPRARASVLRSSAIGVLQFIYTGVSRSHKNSSGVTLTLNRRVEFQRGADLLSSHWPISTLAFRRAFHAIRVNYVRRRSVANRLFFLERSLGIRGCNGCSALSRASTGSIELNCSNIPSAAPV